LHSERGGSLAKIFSANAVTKSQERFWTANAGPKGSAQGRAEQYIPVGYRKNILFLRLAEKPFAIDPPLGCRVLGHRNLGDHELLGV
jgi:hypothetical protein